MLKRLIPALGLVALLLCGCGAAKSGPKVYSAGFEHNDSTAVISPMVLNGKNWKPVGQPITLTFERQDGAVTTVLDTLRMVEIQGVQYAQLSYLNSYNGGKELDYAVSLVALADGATETVSFSGRNLMKPSALPNFKIEGISNLAFVENPSPATEYLAALIAADERLVVLPEDVYLTDKAIEWWVERNPKAMSSAKKFEIGSIPAESSLAAAFGKARKEAKGKYQCVAIDARGYTCLVIRNTSNGNYILAWALPVCTNRQTQWYLKNFYFENETTLAMIYYKGSSMAKIRLNLVSKTITRS